MTVHLVIKQGGAAAAPPAAAAPSPTPAAAPPARFTILTFGTFFLTDYDHSGAPPPDPAQSPFGLGGFGGIPGMGNLGGITSLTVCNVFINSLRLFFAKK